MRAVSSRSGRKPSRVCCSRTKLLISKPAPVSNTTVNATCETTNNARRRCAPKLPPSVGLPAFNASVNAVCEARNAGSVPNNSPASTVSEQVNASTRPSTPISPFRGIVLGNSALIGVGLWTSYTWHQAGSERDKKGGEITGQISSAQGQGHKQFFVRRKIEPRRQHTDHRVALLVKADRAAHHVGVCAKLSLPYSVTEQDNLGAALPIFFRCQIPAVQRLHAERRQQASRDARAIDVLRHTAPSQVERCYRVSAELRERTVLQRQVANIRTGKVSGRLPIHQEHQAFGFRERHRS